MYAKTGSSPKVTVLGGEGPACVLSLHILPVLSSVSAGWLNMSAIINVEVVKDL